MLNEGQKQGQGLINIFGVKKKTVECLVLDVHFFRF